MKGGQSGSQPVSLNIFISTTCHFHTQNIDTQIKQDWNGSCSQPVDSRQVDRLTGSFVNLIYGTEGLRVVVNRLNVDRVAVNQLTVDRLTGRQVDRFIW